MKKILILLMLLCTVVCASASGPNLVIDNADLLTDSQEQMLNEYLADIQTRYGIDIVVLTEPSIGNHSPMEYADDYYDYNGYSIDGALLLLSMEERDWWLSTSGECIWLLDADSMSEHFVPLLSSGDYYDAFSLFAHLVDISAAQPDGVTGYYVDENGVVQAIPYITHWYDGLSLCLIIGIIAGGITVAIMATGMRSVRAQISAAEYVDQGSLELTRQEDRYLYQTVTRRAKPKNNSGTHTGSSGRSHGGGGGKF